MTRPRASSCPESRRLAAEDHEARFIAEVVDDLLDLSVIYASYTTADGAPPYDRA